MRETVRPNCHTWTQSHLTSGHTPTVSDTRCRCAETEPEPSSRTAGRCVEQRRTWDKEHLETLFSRKPLIPTFFLSLFISHTRTVTPRYQPPSMSDSVTSHCMCHTYPLRSNHQPSRTFSGDKKTGDSSRTNPPLARNKQQYAPQITLIQNTQRHLGVFTAPSGCPQYPESPS